MKVVVDRFEGDWAVLLTADRQQLTVPRKSSQQGQMRAIIYTSRCKMARSYKRLFDEQATEDARQRIQAKLDRLRRGDHLKD